MYLTVTLFLSENCDLFERCSDSKCDWKTLQIDSDCLLEWDLGHAQLSRDESQTFQHTRSVHIVSQQESAETFGKETHRKIKNFVEGLHNELENVYRPEGR